MRRSSSFAYITCLLLCFTHQGLSQIGQTKEQLIQRYGQCHPDPGGKPKEPSAYDSVIDVGKNCTFRSDGLIITALFKDGKAVALDYRAQHTLAESLLAAQSESYRGLSELEILRLLWIAVPGAQWVNLPSNWHEVAVLPPDGTRLEYVNCDRRTGLLPFLGLNRRSGYGA